MDLQRNGGSPNLFISHNLAAVAHISHRIAVMYLGRIIEYTDKTALFANPQHSSTEALLSAVPVQGDVPSPVKSPPGCHLPPCCPYAVERCRVEAPGLREIAPGHRVALKLETRPEFLLHFLALNSLGVSVLPLNPDYREAELRYVLEHSEASAVIDAQTLEDPPAPGKPESWYFDDHKNTIIGGAVLTVVLYLLLEILFG